MPRPAMHLFTSEPLPLPSCQRAAMRWSPRRCLGRGRAQGGSTARGPPSSSSLLSTMGLAIVLRCLAIVLTLRSPLWCTSSRHDMSWDGRRVSALLFAAPLFIFFVLLLGRMGPIGRSYLTASGFVVVRLGIDQSATHCSPI